MSKQHELREIDYINIYIKFLKIFFHKKIYLETTYHVSEKEL